MRFVTLKLMACRSEQNDYMGIGDKAILAVGTDLKETTMKMIDAMVDEDSAIVSIYYGADETEEACTGNRKNDRRKVSGC